MRPFQTRFSHLVVGSLLLSVLLSLPLRAAQIFVVDGTVKKADGTPAPAGLDVTVENTTGKTRLGHDVVDTKKTDATGAFSIFMPTNFAEEIALASDSLQVTVQDGASVVGQTTYVLTAADVTNAKATVSVKLLGVSIALSSAVLKGDGAATSSVTVTVVNKDGAAVTDDTITASASIGALGAFTHAGNGVYTATYTAAAVETTTPATITATSGSVGLTVTAKLSLVVATGSTGEEGVKGSVLAVTGTATYDDGTSALPLAEGIAVEVILNGQTQTTTVGQAGAGKFAVSFLNPFGTVVTSGDIVTVKLIRSGSAVAETSVVVSSNAVQAAELSVGVINSGLKQPEATSNVLAVSGSATYQDGATPLGSSENVTVEITIRGRTETQTLGSAGAGKFSIAFFNATAPVVGTGDLVVIRLLKGGKEVGAATIPASSNDVKAGVLDAKSLSTTLSPSTTTLVVTGTVRNADGTGPAAAGTTVRVTNLTRAGLAPQTGTVGSAGAGKFSVVFFAAIGDPVAVTGDEILLEAFSPVGASLGRSKLTLTAAQILGAAANVEFQLAGELVVGGLAIDVPNYIRLIQQALNTATDSPDVDAGTRALIKSLLPQLVRSGALLGVAIPIFPASLDEKPTQPVLVPDPTGLDLENFGNPLFIPLLDASAENPQGLLDGSFRVPMALVGNKMNLYVRGGSEAQIQVELKSASGATIPLQVENVSATGAFDYTFTMDEELTLLVLPAWPGSDLNPLEAVTLFLSENGNVGPYREIAMAPTMFTGSSARRGWTATESLKAGKVYHYYYRVRLSNPIPISTIPASFTREWALPDVRNLQFEDRGFPNSADAELRRPVLDAIALRIQPILGGLIKSIETEATRIAQDALLKDPAIQAEIANDPEIRAILLAKIQNDAALQARILSNPAAQTVIQNRLRTDGSIQAQLLSDPAIQAALATNPTVLAKQTEIAAQVVNELKSNPTVVAAAQAAANAAAQNVLLSGGTPAQAEAAGAAAAATAAEAKIRELAPAIVETRLRAALPSLLSDPSVAAAVLPIAAPKILPVVASDLVPIVGPDVLPLIQADIQPIIISKYGSRFLNQALAAVIGDTSALVSRITAELLPFTQKVGAEITATLEVPLVSKFTVPAKTNLRVVTADMSAISDGVYTVQILDETGGVRIAKPITIDRSPGTVDELTITPTAGAGAYVREADGVLVAAPVAQTGTLEIGATIQGDAQDAIFQMIGIEDDPAKQGARVWVPVNQSAVLIATALATPEKVQEDDVYDSALLALVLSDPELVRKAQSLDPEGVAAFLVGYNALSDAKKAEVQLLATLIRELVIKGNFAAASSLLSLNFATLQEYAVLLANMRVTAPLIAGTSGSIRMLFPPAGKYGIRAVALDQYGNISSYQTPKRVDVVSPDPDQFAITSLSVGDQNGDGDPNGAFEAVAVGADGTVDPAVFRIFANFKNIAINYANTARTAHPLTKVALQVSLNGQTWDDIASLTADELAAVKQGDTFSVDYAFDAQALVDADVTQVRVRVVAENKLTVADASAVTALTVDPNPLAIEPKIVSFAAVRDASSTVSPDSGGERGTMNLTATTSSFTNPALQGVRFEVSADGGATWAALDAASGGAGTGLVSASSPVEGTSTVAWALAWDTTQVADSVTNVEPEARDASQDDNPYLLRAVPVDVADVDYAASETVSVSTDNVDDVGPANGSAITLVERQARNLVDYESALSADGTSWVIRSNARLTIQVAAEPSSFVGGKVALVTVDAAGAVTGTVAELDAADTKDYQLVLDSTAFDNGSYAVAALVTDADGNQESVIAANVATVDVKNIRIAGLDPADANALANIVITRTGAFTALKRTLAQAISERPISGATTITVESAEADSASLVVAADPAMLSDDALRLLDPAAPAVDFDMLAVVGTRPAGSAIWSFALDANQIGDGEVSARLVLGGSPNVFSPVVVIGVDNTPPDLAYIAPMSGSTVGTRPYVWAEYGDASGVVQLSFSLDTLAKNLVTADFGNPDAVLADSDAKGLSVKATRVVYSPPDVASRLAGGPHTSSATVTDRAGNVSTMRVPFIVANDTTAPNILSFSPTGTLTNPKPVVTVTFTDIVSGVTDAGVKITVLGVGGTTKLAHASGADAKAGEPVLSGTATFVPDADLAPGDYSVTAVLTDVDGNSAPVSWQFAITADTAKPVVTAHSPVGTINATETWIVVSFSDESKVTATVRLDGGAAENAEVVDTRARLKVAGLTQGVHTAIVSLKDARNNEAVVQWDFSVEIDVTAPVISAYTPTGYTGTNKPTILVSYSDAGVGVNLDSIAVSVDGKKVEPNAKDASRASYTPKDALASGAHSVFVELADALGNGASANWTFTIETTPPSITSVVPAPGTKVRGDEETRGNVIVTAFYSDNQAGIAKETAKITVTSQGESVAGAATAESNAIAWKASAPLKAGVYRASVEVKDAVGNATSHSWLFMIEEETALTSAPMRIVPNPSEGEASLWFGLGQEADVSVRIYDFGQRLVAERGAEYLTPGVAKVGLETQLAELARGVYLVQVTIEPRFAGERVIKLLKLAKVR